MIISMGCFNDEEEKEEEQDNDIRKEVIDIQVNTTLRDEGNGLWQGNIIISSTDIHEYFGTGSTIPVEVIKKNFTCLFKRRAI